MRLSSSVPERNCLCLIAFPYAEPILTISNVDIVHHMYGMRLEYLRYEFTNYKIWSYIDLRTVWRQWKIVSGELVVEKCEAASFTVRVDKCKIHVIRKIMRLYNERFTYLWDFARSIYSRKFPRDVLPLHNGHVGDASCGSFAHFRRDEWTTQVEWTSRCSWHWFITG